MSETLAEVRSDLPVLLADMPGPKARDIIARDHQTLSPSYTRSYPLVAGKAEGAIVEDVDGNRFLDFNAGIAVVATGHCHPAVVESVQRQAARLLHMSGTDFYYENMVTLGETLADFYYENMVMLARSWPPWRPAASSAACTLATPGPRPSKQP